MYGYLLLIQEEDDSIEMEVAVEVPGPNEEHFIMKKRIDADFDEER